MSYPKESFKQNDSGLLITPYIFLGNKEESSEALARVPVAGWAGPFQKVSRPCHLVTRCYNCKTPKPASPGAFGDSWLSSRMSRGKHKGRCPASRVHAEPKAGMESLPCCLGTRPSLQVTVACPLPGIGGPPMSIASPVLPTSRCCVRCWQGLRLFRRSLDCLDKRQNPPATGNGTSEVPTQRQQEWWSLVESPDISFQWLALLFLLDRALQRASNLAV